MYHQALIADKSQCQDLSPGSSDPKGHMLFKHFYGSLETTGRIIQGQGLRARGGHQCLTNVKAGRKRVEERKPPEPARQTGLSVWGFLLMRAICAHREARSLCLSFATVETQIGSRSLLCLFPPL